MPTDRAAIERAIRRAGCRIKSFEMRNGEPLWLLECNTHANKVRLLDEVATVDSQEPEIRALASQIAQGRTPLEAAIEVQRIGQFIPYVPEEMELFIGAKLALVTGGDCDDSARFVLAVLRAMGLVGRLATIWDPPGHVATQLGTAEGWMWLEASVAALPGEHPLVARDRLQL